MTDDRPEHALRSPLEHYAPKLNALERRALVFLESRTNASGTPPLDDGERRELGRISRRTVLLGALSGTVSGVLIGGVEIYLRLGVLSGEDERSIFEDPWLWSAFYAFVGVLTVIEIVFLYWIALRAISRMREVIGIAIPHEDASSLVHAGLARGALEIPNPHTPIYGIDPYELMPRWKLLVWNLLYKAKVGVTSFVLRILMRRVFARAVLRGYIPLLAVPLYAGWNAFILWRVMEETRLRALGPFAVSQAVDIAKRHESDEAWRQTVLAGVGEMIRRSGDAHPNYALLLSELLSRLAPQKNGFPAEWRKASSAIGGLAKPEKEDLVDLLTIMAILAGRPARAQVRLLREVCERASRPFEAGRTARFRLLMRDGRPFGALPRPD